MKTHHAPALSESFLELCTRQLNQANSKEEVMYFAWYALGGIWAFFVCEAISISDRKLWISHIETLATQRKAELSQGCDR